MNGVYRRYRLELFPKLLKDPSVSPEDKRQICELLKKPWNPYLRRHVGLTEKSKILKENIVKQYSGWSGRSQMPKVLALFWQRIIRINFGSIWPETKIRRY
jgi:hypothetical protein